MKLSRYCYFIFSPCWLEVLPNLSTNQQKTHPLFKTFSSFSSSWTTATCTIAVFTHLEAPPGSYAAAFYENDCIKSSWSNLDNFLDFPTFRPLILNFCCTSWPDTSLPCTLHEKLYGIIYPRAKLVCLRSDTSSHLTNIQSWAFPRVLHFIKSPYCKLDEPDTLSMLYRNVENGFVFEEWNARIHCLQYVLFKEPKKAANLV